MRSYVYLMIDQEKTAQRQKGVCFILPPPGSCGAHVRCRTNVTEPELITARRFRIAAAA